MLELFRNTLLNKNIALVAPQLLRIITIQCVDTERVGEDGEIVDKLKQNERVPGRHQYAWDCSPMAQRQTLSVSFMGSAEGVTTPGWWFYHFDSVWRPFIQSLSRQKNVTLHEFERAASQVPGLTPIEKTIAISAFRQQQEDGLLPSHHTTAFRKRSLSAV